jgi:hypothetical protein
VAPVLSTFLISVAVQFVALRVPELPPWVFFTRNGVSIVLARGNTRERLLSALGSPWLNGGILTLGVPLSMIVERHFSLSIKLTAFIVYMIAWCLIPAVFLRLRAALARTQGHAAGPERHPPLATLISLPTGSWPSNRPGPAP